MKKKLLMLFTASLAITIAKAQNDWITYKVDDKLSVKLPAQPRKIDDATQMAFDKDTLIYVVSLVDLLKTDGTDSAKLASICTTPEYVNTLKESFTKSIAGYVFGDITVGKWKGYTDYYIEGVNASQKRKIYCFLFIIGTKLYGLSTLVPDNKSSKGKDDFYASAVVN